jgi:hypothetical protein
MQYRDIGKRTLNSGGGTRTPDRFIGNSGRRQRQRRKIRRTECTDVESGRQFSPDREGLAEASRIGAGLHHGIA